MDILRPVHMTWFSDSETFNLYLTGQPAWFKTRKPNKLFKTPTSAKPQEFHKRLKGTNAKFGNSPETTERKPKQLLPRSQTRQKQSWSAILPAHLVLHLPKELSLTLSVLSWQQPLAGEQRLPPEPAARPAPNGPCFPLGSQPAWGCEPARRHPVIYTALLTPCMLVQLPLLL